VLLLLLSIEAPSHLPLDTFLFNNHYKFIMASQVSNLSKSHLPLQDFLTSQISKFEQINFHSSF